jgi:MFS family permease
LIGCYFYSTLQIPDSSAPRPTRVSIRAGVEGVNRVLGGDRTYRAFQFAYFLSGSAFFMSTHVVLLLAREELRFSPLQLAVWMSMTPQLVLAASSPLWGWILDRIGIIRCRVLISILSTVYLACYLLGVLLRIPALIWAGSILFGFGNSGGQLTWALGSTYFAARVDDVPMYNGIHFVLNGIRGLLLPWVGSILFVTVGRWSVLAATMVSFASVLASLYSWQLERWDQRLSVDPARLKTRTQT